MDDLVITNRFTVPASELEAMFSRSSGPGGQNVNKTNSKVSLRWQLSSNTSLPSGARMRVQALAGSRYNHDGTILVTCQEHRDQAQNLKACRQKLRALILQSLTVPKIRKPTAPSRAAQQRRIDQKRQLSQRKQSRTQGHWDRW